MTAKIPDLQEWDRMSYAECKTLSRNLYPPLPLSCFFQGVELVKSAVCERHVAFYEWGGSRFALIPGGKAVLGYDRAKPFRPTLGQKKSWDKNCRSNGYSYALKDYLDENLSPRREVEIKPFLLEAHSSRLGLMPAPKRPPGQPLPPEEAFVGEYRGFRQMPVTHDLASMMASISNPGQRLPSSDEWEYACGAGAGTLFHWGDDCPTDRYPIDDDDGFKLHRQPNAFGLQMPFNPYTLEWCAERNILRGGDGGGNICGSADWFVGWLPLATAFIYHEDDRLLSGGYLRRAFSLG